MPSDWDIPKGAKVGKITIEFRDAENRWFLPFVIQIHAEDLAKFEAAAEAIEIVERTIAAAKRLAALKP